MNSELRKLNRKIDNLQKQINQQNNFIIDQSLIIHKLIEKLTFKPFGTPWDSTPVPSPLDPYNEPFTSTPWQPSNVKCPSCKRDTGIPFVLHMVIPPEGLKCPHCGAVAVMGISITCNPNPHTTTMPCDSTTLKDYSTDCNINTSSGDSNIKAYNHYIRDENSVTGGNRVINIHKAYDYDGTVINHFAGSIQ